MHHRIVSSILVSWLMFCSHLVVAQGILNSERMMSVVDTHTVQLQTDIELTNGNNVIADIEGSLLLYHDWKKHCIKGALEGEYLLDNGITSAAAYAGQFRYLYALKPSLDLYCFAQGQYDNVLLYRGRYLGGGGVRKQFQNRSDSSNAQLALVLAHGYFAEQEYYNDLGSVFNEKEKFSVRMSHMTLFKVSFTRAAITVMNYFQPSLKQLNDFRSLTDVLFFYELNDILGLTIGFEWRYDNRPHNGLGNHDYELTNGLVLLF